RGDGRERDAGGDLLDPGVERGPEIAPFVRRAPQDGCIAARLDQAVLEQVDRGGADELAGIGCSVAAGKDRHGAEGAGVAGAPEMEAAVEHDTAADERADEEIDE